MILSSCIRNGPKDLRALNQSRLICLGYNAKARVDRCRFAKNKRFPEVINLCIDDGLECGRMHDNSQFLRLVAITQDSFSPFKIFISELHHITAMPQIYDNDFLKFLSANDFFSQSQEHSHEEKIYIFENKYKCTFLLKSKPHLLCGWLARSQDDDQAGLMGMRMRQQRACS